MNTVDVLRWIKKNLSDFIGPAINGTDWTISELAGITCRETGDLIARHAPLTKDLNAIASVMMGDKSKRPGETLPWYHGFGFTQIDIWSYPDFVKSGDWKDPAKVYKKTIEILEGKKDYLSTRVANSKDLKRYTIAAYNCGEGNESKVIARNIDPDAYTAGHNYSKQVLVFASIYDGFNNEN